MSQIGDRSRADLDAWMQRSLTLLDDAIAWEWEKLKDKKFAGLAGLAQSPATERDTA